MPTGGYKTELLYSALEPDFTTTMMMVYEYATDVHPNGITRFPTLQYRRRVTPETSLIDDLHREPLPADREWQDYSFPIFVSANPKRQELSGFGIDEPRDLLAYLALPVLEEQGLVVQKNLQEIISGVESEVAPADPDGGPLRFLIDQGDRLFFQGHQYEILTMHEDQFFSNTEIPMYLVAACEKHQLDTSTDTSLDDSDDDWRDDLFNPDHAL